MFRAPAAGGSAMRSSLVERRSADAMLDALGPRSTLVDSAHVTMTVAATQLGSGRLRFDSGWHRSGQLQSQQPPRVALVDLLALLVGHINAVHRGDRVAHEPRAALGIEWHIRAEQHVLDAKELE